MSSDITTLVKNTFTSKGAEQFWHYVANNYFEPGYYDPTVVEQRVSTIVSKIGKNCFDSQQNFQMTPLHVTAIRGNRVGLKFFLSQKINTQLVDQYGKRAEDYLRELHPTLLELFPLGSILKKVFSSAVWQIALKPMKTPYRKHTQDFGREIKSLFIGHSFNGEKVFNGRVLSDLKTACQQLGITTREAQNQTLFYPRDQWARSCTGNLVKPNFHLNPENLPDTLGDQNTPEETLDKIKKIARTFTHDQSEAIKASERCNSLLKKSASSLTSLHYFKRISGLVNTYQHGLSLLRSSVIVGEVELQVDKINNGNFHFDGGNVFILTNGSGNPTALVGRDHYYTDYMLYRKDPTHLQWIIDLKAKAFNMKADEWEASVKKKIRATISIEEILDRVAEIVALGIDRAEEMENEESGINAAVDIEFALNLFHYAAAGSFALQITELFHISQANYHLDTFMVPGPNHSLFIQDYQLCAEMLQAIKEGAKALNLTTTDLKHLDCYLATAKRLQKELGGLMKSIHAEANSAGFTVIPTPGTFVYAPEESAAPTHPINFMNALTGWSSKINRYYFITTGCQVGNTLGKVLMNSFQAFLSHYVPKIQLYYLGKDPQNQEDFSEAMLWSQEERQAGVHCFTLELETADHTDEEHKE